MRLSNLQRVNEHQQAPAWYSRLSALAVCSTVIVSPSTIAAPLSTESSPAAEPQYQADSQRPSAQPGEPTSSTPDDGLVTIESDLQTADSVTGVITAVGNVRIVYPNRGVVATSRQAQFFTRENRIVLSGDVDVIEKDGNALRAERVTYLVDEEKAVADPPPGEQVFTTLFLQRAVSPQPIGPVTPEEAQTPEAATP